MIAAKTGKSTHNNAIARKEICLETRPSIKFHSQEVRTLENEKNINPTFQKHAHKTKTKFELPCDCLLYFICYRIRSTECKSEYNPLEWRTQPLGKTELDPRNRGFQPLSQY